MEDDDSVLDGWGDFSDPDDDVHAGVVGGAAVPAAVPPKTPTPVKLAPEETGSDSPEWPSSPTSSSRPPGLSAADVHAAGVSNAQPPAARTTLAATAAGISASIHNATSSMAVTAAAPPPSGAAVVLPAAHRRGSSSAPGPEPSVVAAVQLPPPALASGQGQPPAPTPVPLVVPAATTPLAVVPEPLLEKAGPSSPAGEAQSKPRRYRERGKAARQHPCAHANPTKGIAAFTSAPDGASGACSHEQLRGKCPCCLCTSPVPLLPACPLAARRISVSFALDSEPAPEGGSDFPPTPHAVTKPQEASGPPRSPSGRLLHGPPPGLRVTHPGAGGSAEPSGDEAEAGSATQPSAAGVAAAPAAAAAAAAASAPGPAANGGGTDGAFPTMAGLRVATTPSYVHGLSNTPGSPLGPSNAPGSPLTPRSRLLAARGMAPSPLRLAPDAVAGEGAARGITYVSSPHAPAARLGSGTDSPGLSPRLSRLAGSGVVASAAMPAGLLGGPDGPNEDGDGDGGMAPGPEDALLAATPEAVLPPQPLPPPPAAPGAPWQPLQQQPVAAPAAPGLAAVAGVPPHPPQQQPPLAAPPSAAPPPALPPSTLASAGSNRHRLSVSFALPAGQGDEHDSHASGQPPAPPPAPHDNGFLPQGPPHRADGGLGPGPGHPYTHSHNAAVAAQAQPSIPPPHVPAGDAAHHSSAPPPHHQHPAPNTHAHAHHHLQPGHLPSPPLSDRDESAGYNSETTSEASAPTSVSVSEAHGPHAGGGGGGGGGHAGGAGGAAHGQAK